MPSYRGSRSVSFLLFVVGFSLPLFQTLAEHPPRNDQRIALRDDATLRGIAFADERHGWVVGDIGTILSTVDGGETWLPQESGVTCTLKHVTCLDKKRAWAVGGWYDAYTRISHGVVLATETGGVTWRTLSNSLPFLTWIKFEDARQGTAIGDWSVDFSSSCFNTVDGGISWSPATGIDAGPLIAATGTQPNWFLDRQGGIWRQFAGKTSELVVGKQIVSPEGKLSSQSILHSAICSDNELLIAAGPGNGNPNLLGGSLRDVPSNLTDTSKLPLLPLSITIGRDKLAVGGFPSQQLMNVEFGSPPTFNDPRICGAVHGMFLHECGRKVAVGSFGAISICDPKTTSWRIVRGENRQTGMLVIASEASQIPWSLVASESMQHAARVAIIVWPNAVDDRMADPLWPGTAALLTECCSIAGANEAIVLPNTSRLDAVAHSIEAWRPAAVCFALGLNEQLRDQAWEALNRSHNLQGIRVVEVTDRTSGWYRLDPAAALPAAGELAYDAQLTADAMFRRGVSSPKSVECRPLLNLSIRQRPEGITARLPAEIAQRITKMTPRGTPRQLARLQARTKFPEMIQRLHELHGQDVNRFRAQLVQLLSHVGAEDRELLIMGLADRCGLLGDQAAWIETVRLVANSNVNDSLNRWGLEMKTKIEISCEWQHAIPLLTAIPTPLVATTEGGSGRSPFESETRPERSDYSIAAASFARSRFPVNSNLTTRTKPKDPFECFRVMSGEAGWREQALEQFASNRGSGIWSLRAREEITAARDNVGTTRNPEWNLLTVSPQRPKLDGLADDLVWSTAVEVDGVKFAYDAQFIYLLASTSLTISTAATEKSRDARLDDSERFVIEIDTDHDMSTAFRFEVDGAGRTRDSVDGFVTWNPRWFVALGDSEKTCRLEVAIHRDDLSDLPPLTGDSWRVRVRRAAPGGRLPFGPVSDPFDWHLANFR